MTIARALSAVGLIESSNRKGFCPACRLLLTDDGASEVAAPAVVAAVVLGVAVVGWVITVRQSESMAMGMGLGTLPSFAVWVVMMAAMMLPSALPMVYEYGRRIEGRRGWMRAVAVVVVTYPCGVVAVRRHVLRGLQRPGHAVATATADRWRSVAAGGGVRHNPHQACERRAVPRAVRAARPSPVRPHAQRAFRRCSLRPQLRRLQRVMIGMNSLVWMEVLAVFLLIYKLGSAPPLRRSVVLAAAFAAMGLVHALLPA